MNFGLAILTPSTSSTNKGIMLLATYAETVVPNPTGPEIDIANFLGKKIKTDVICLILTQTPESFWSLQEVTHNAHD